ncbi:MAG: hypothetical protein RMY34_27040, partial [Aulosira sp. DedQUE10]|nr:hypothetical protein [Aulosira sp. DedQUE10]
STQVLFISDRLCQLRKSWCQLNVKPLSKRDASVFLLPIKIRVTPPQFCLKPKRPLPACGEGIEGWGKTLVG